MLTPTSAVTLSATTAIASGSTIGMVLILQGTSDINTVSINSGANTKLRANPIVLGANETLTLIWNGSLWVEVCDSENQAPAA
jgi:hypothetical protein